MSVSAAVKTEQRESEETFLKVARDGNHEAVTTMVLSTSRYTFQLACPSVWLWRVSFITEQRECICWSFVLLL